ncbi:PAS domain-containing sensor histidine kinase [Sphingomonas sp.]|uniref:sensor histidine kinase n=1 Tax=Sphingomonas sp. TaxID=28214 RepID=UPI001D60B1F0|nr:PAS domain-containing sensor histidine kinase [Sphingomonas sp.]MBX9796973.1 PAS-domain containing protein [Sphingomonas sp.]
MIVLTPLAATIVGAVLAVLIALAGWALFAGLSARAEARALAAGRAQLDALLAASPAQAMLVHPNGRVVMSEQLGRWLGLPRPAQFLGELTRDGAGIVADDLAALHEDIAAAHKAARPFTRRLRVTGAATTLVARGERGGRAVEGAVVVWLIDASDTETTLARLQAESAQLHAAFDALTGLIEAAPIPMWYRGADLKLMMVNTAYVQAVEGRDADDVVARGLELIEGLGTGGPLANAAAAREQRRPVTQALPATMRGARRMLQLVDVPLPSGGVGGFAVDIEELEQARAALKRFAEAQRAMLDRLSAGVAQFDADRSLAFCNQPFRRLFAMKPEWLSDRPEFDRVLERMREAKRLPEVRDFPGWKAERRDWFMAAEAAEEQWHLPGGTHLRVVAQPLPDGGLLLIFEDRTEQVQLASARDTLLRVRTATFDNLYEALGVFAADGRLQLWNNRFRQAWGFEEELLAAHPRVDALAKAAEAKLAKPGKAVLISEMVRSATLDRQQRGGDLAFADGRHFEFAAVPLPDGNALFTMIDVTDSRKIEHALRDRNEALEAADRVKTAFVANMSYELRTPLTSISGFAEMLKAGYGGPLDDAATGYVAAILESVERLSALVDDVLDLTQGERAPALETAAVDVAALARDVAARLAPVMAARKLDFVVDPQPSSGAVTGDPARLGQVIENLLRHASGGLSEGGRVLLHCDGDATHARIIVSDNGRGMTPKAIARAFDRFAEPGITRSGERALGLGLPLAKQFVEAHGGTIELVSERGQGTLITVTLPRRRA